MLELSFARRCNWVIATLGRNIYCSAWFVKARELALRSFRASTPISIGSANKYESILLCKSDRATVDGADVSSPRLTDVPKCQRCHSDLDQFAVYRFITVEPISIDLGMPPIAVEVVFCSRCGTVLEMFKAEASD